jgi:hypothetical protein
MRNQQEGGEHRVTADLTCDTLRHARKAFHAEPRRCGGFLCGLRVSARNAFDYLYADQVSPSLGGLVSTLPLSGIPVSEMIALVIGTCGR